MVWSAARACSPRQVWLVASYSMRFALRTGGGLTFLMLFLVAGLSVSSIVIEPVEGLIEKMSADGVESADLADQILSSGIVSGGVEWLTGADEAQSKYLLEKKPALLSSILLILMLLIPCTTCLAAFNQTAGDIGSKGLRFLLLRTERANIFFGRFIGAMFFTLISTVLVMSLIIAYIQFKLGIYNGGALWAWGLLGFIAIFFLTLPYVALCAWISTWFDSAFGSLAICMLAAGGSVVVIMLMKVSLVAGGVIQSEQLSWMMRLLPWGWKYDLLHGNFGTRLLGMVVMLGFTALFLILGMRRFNKRDL